jgi:ankyrin repeat protein
MKVVNKLVEHIAVDVNIANITGFTALLAAANFGHANIISKLLKLDEMRKLNVNAQNNKGSSSLILAAQKGFDKIVAILGADPRVDLNAGGNQGQTALFGAAGKGHEGVIRELLECNEIDADAPDGEKNTAIMAAGSIGNDRIVSALAEAGANLSPPYSLRSVVDGSRMSSEKKVATNAVLKRHGVASNNVPSNFQSKYYFQDGEGRFYIRNLKHQR